MRANQLDSSESDSQSLSMPSAERRGSGKWKRHVTRENTQDNLSECSAILSTKMKDEFYHATEGKQDKEAKEGG